MRIKSRLLKDVLVVLLTVSLLGNVIFAYLYFFKFLPNLHKIENQLVSAQSKTNNCKKVFSLSEGKTVCLTKEIALSNCSQNAGKIFTTDVLASLKSLSDVEKLRDLSIKICMQNQGFDY